jgi:16S rRNA C967 or C1407 C5-methylase (RsmB/RsmF family)
MPTIQVEAHLSRRDLLKATEQLDAAEFQQFVADVLGLRARRQAPHLSATESELLLIVNRGLPENLRERYRELIGKRRQQTLAPAELEELLRLTDQVEQLEADRLAALSELAQLRQTTLPTLMANLGLRAPAHE